MDEFTPALLEFAQRLLPAVEARTHYVVSKNPEFDALPEERRNAFIDGECYCSPCADISFRMLFNMWFRSALHFDISNRDHTELAGALYGKMSDVVKKICYQDVEEACKMGIIASRGDFFDYKTQTITNSSDITALRGDISGLTDRMARLEEKVDRIASVLDRLVQQSS
jgi:hypothetical protein